MFDKMVLLFLKETGLLRFFRRAADWILDALDWLENRWSSLVCLTLKHDWSDWTMSSHDPQGEWRTCWRCGKSEEQ